MMFALWVEEENKYNISIVIVLRGTVLHAKKEIKTFARF